MKFNFGIDRAFFEEQETKTKLIYPLSLSEVKRHLRIDIDWTEDDDYLEDLIEASTQAAEDYIGKDIAYTSTVLRINDFNSDWIQIYDGNFISVASVTDSNLAALGTVYQTTKKENSFFIEWTDTIASDPIYITYYSGYAENAWPALIKQSILLQLAELYDVDRSTYIFGSLQKTDIFERLLNRYQLKIC